MEGKRYKIEDVGAGLVPARNEQNHRDQDPRGRKTEGRVRRIPDLEIDNSLLDIGHSFSSEYPIINIQCPISSI